jgi:hypothetical protein
MTRIIIIIIIIIIISLPYILPTIILLTRTHSPTQLYFCLLFQFLSSVVPTAAPRV